MVYRGLVVAVHHGHVTLQHRVGLEVPGEEKTLQGSGAYSGGTVSAPPPELSESEEKEHCHSPQQ